MRRARGQLKGPIAFAGLVVLAGCSRPADAVPAAPAGQSLTRFSIDATGAVR